MQSTHEKIFYRYGDLIRQLSLGQDDLKTLLTSLHELFDPAVIFEMEDREMNLSDYDRLCEYIHSDSLYTQFEIEYATVLTGEEKLGFHQKVNITPKDGKKFPGTEYEMQKPKGPFQLFGVVTFKNNKIIKVEQRSDEARRVLGVPGDHLGEKSYLNTFTRNLRNTKIWRQISQTVAIFN